MSSPYQQYLTLRSRNPSALAFVRVNGRLRAFDETMALVAVQFGKEPVRIGRYLVVDLTQAQVDSLAANDHQVVIAEDAS